jgi:hypothetical protein
MSLWLNTSGQLAMHKARRQAYLIKVGGTRMIYLALIATVKINGTSLNYFRF